MKGKGSGELIEKIKTIKLRDDKNKKKFFRDIFYLTIYYSECTGSRRVK